MVSLLAIRSMVRAFKPDRGDGSLRAVIIRHTPSFGGEVKPLTSCRKILRYVKLTCKHDEKYLPKPYS
jgi:hypothetical protein